MYSSPTYVSFELTGDCNLNCRHCYGKFPRKKRGELTTKEVCTVIDELYKSGVMRLELGGGEPALRTDFIDIVAHTHKYSNINTTIVTNGIPWNEELVKDFAKFKDNKIVHVSMDGYNPETYSVLRRNVNGFDRALETSINMVKHGIDVRWNFAVGKLTYKYLPETLRLAKEIGVKHVRLMVLYNTGRAAENDEMGFTYEEYKSFAIDYIENIKKNSPVSVTLSLAQPFEFFVPLMDAGYTKDEIKKYIPNAISSLDDEEYIKQTNLACPAGRMQSSITSTGDMYFCCMLTSVPEFSGGNIFKQDIKQIWNESPLFKWVRSLRLEDLNSNCSQCKYKTICGGGCRARAYFYSGDFLAPDPLCPFAIKQNKQQVLHPIIENIPQDLIREVQTTNFSDAFSLKIQDNIIRIRPEEFGACIFVPQHSYLNVNKSGLELLKTLYETNDECKTVKILAEKHKLQEDVVSKIVVNFLDRLKNISKDYVYRE